MKKLILAALAALIAGTSLAQQFSPPAPPFTPPAPAVLRIVEDFTTIFVSCGTPVTPTCPKTLEPLERPVLLHYVTLGGRSETDCSGWLFVNRTTPQGVVRTELMRLVLAAGAIDNIALTFPTPLRLEAGDVIGIAVAQGLCGVIADLGVEFAD